MPRVNDAIGHISNVHFVACRMTNLRGYQCGIRKKSEHRNFTSKLCDTTTSKCCCTKWLCCNIVNCERPSSIYMYLLFATDAVYKQNSIT